MFDTFELTKFGETQNHVFRPREYQRQLDMAKELSMVDVPNVSSGASVFIAWTTAVTSHNNLVELNAKLKMILAITYATARCTPTAKELTHTEIARCLQISTRQFRTLYREMYDLELIPSQEVLLHIQVYFSYSYSFSN